MKTLNNKATKIFTDIINLMNGEPYLKIENDPYMPLSIEKIQEAIETPDGKAVLYSLSHNYVQNGDLMRDPEMLFIVLDGSDEINGDLSLVKIFPAMYQQDNLGIYQESIIITDGILKSYYPKPQTEHTEFADLWLNNIKNQGFIRNTSK